MRPGRALINDEGRLGHKHGTKSMPREEDEGFYFFGPCAWHQWECLTGRSSDLICSARLPLAITRAGRKQGLLGIRSASPISSALVQCV